MQARACIIFDGLIAESLGWACLLSVRAFARSGDRARARDDNALDAPLHQSFEPAQAQAGNSRDARRLLKLWRSSHGRWPRGLAFSTRGCGGGGCLDHRVNLSRNAPLLVLDRRGQPLPALLETLTTTALLKHTPKTQAAPAAAASSGGRRQQQQARKAGGRRRRRHSNLPYSQLSLAARARTPRQAAVSDQQATMSTAARRRLMRDLKRLQSDPPQGVQGAPLDNNVRAAT